MRTCLPILALSLMLSGCTAGAPGDTGAVPRPTAERGMSIELPKTAGAWTRPDTPKRIDATSIFSYMDGAGELYVGYRFDHLDAYEYVAAGRGPILVELYWMRDSDDAFGLLSNDWGGDPIALQPADADRPPRTVPPARALYGAGLLRIWSDTLYARVMAAAETPESREQVVALGRAIAAGRPLSPRPALLDLLPARVGDRFSIRPDRAWFLRSHLVLNSAYFLASQNILDLSLGCEAAIAPYEADRRPAAPDKNPAIRPHLLVVRYPDAVTARRALVHFLGAYLPGAPPPQSDRPTGGTHRIEHGFVGYRLDDRLLFVAFDAPDSATAAMLAGER